MGAAKYIIWNKTGPRATTSDRSNDKERHMSTTTIVVPCYNEALRLPAALFREFAAAHGNIRFLLVNDGSRDGTMAVLDQLAGLDPAHFEVLNLVENCGKAEAVRRGILQAAMGQPDYIGFWDADLATPLHVIPQFTSVLDRRPEISLLLGVRMPLLGHVIRRRPLRRWLGKVFAQVASGTLGVRFHDTQCGAKIFRVSPEVLAAFSQPFESRWIFDVELLARLIRLRRGNSQPSLNEIAYEFPVDQWEDVAGSKLKGGDFFKAMAELCAIWWRYLRPAARPFIAAPINLESRKVAHAAQRQAA
jgi:glycosyltransferase involved in cell wall biosynthesis